VADRPRQRLCAEFGGGCGGVPLIAKEFHAVLPSPRYGHGFATNFYFSRENKCVSTASHCQPLTWRAPTDAFAGGHCPAPGGRTMGVRLTAKLVRAWEPPPATNGRGNNRITYDDSVPGFGARVTSAGAVSFVLNYRRKGDGLERRFTIGTFPAWSVTAAREEAKRLKRDVDGGGDPVGKFK